MKVAGSATLHAPVETVYAALRDPAVLVRTIPGCERLEQVGEDAYAMTVTAGVASVRGTYAGDVRLTDQRAPHGFVLRAAGSGAPGTVSADVTVELAPGDDGTTRLAYDADAVVGGMIAGVGQRLLTTVAKRTAGEFFTAVDQVLTGGGVEGVPAEVGAPATVGADSSRTQGSGAPALPDAAGAGAATATPAVGLTEVGAAPSGAGTGPRVYTAPARRGAAGPPGGEFAAGVVLGAAAALLGALVGGYLARRAARPDPGGRPRRPGRR
jgi:uncharacterized protein